MKEVNEVVKYGSLINWGEIDNLVGRLLTHVDATTLDPVAREANKSILKSIVREWMRNNDDHSVWGNLVVHAISDDPEDSEVVFVPNRYTAEKAKGESLIPNSH